MTLFKDPEGKYSILIKPEWKYNNEFKGPNENLRQFEVSPKCVFQISCNSLNDGLSKLIDRNKIIPQDKSLPNYSFIEDYEVKSDIEMYSWVALIDDQFFIAAFFFDPKIKDRKNLGLELYDIRFALSRLVVHNLNFNENQCPGFIPEDTDKDYQNIENWRDLPAKYYSNVANKDGLKITQLSNLNIDVIKLYSLLTLKVSHQPNGFYNLLKTGKLLDNPFWWDFILECDKGFIQIWRTPYILEALYYYEEEFNLEDFFNNNIKRFEKEIAIKISTFDPHTIYINHYQSYSECVNTLWKKIQEIDLSLPESPKGHHNAEREMEAYTKKVETFMASSISYHALAKSLVLNAAFKIESFLNLVIRIGSTRELRLYPEVLAKFLKQDFSSRVKNIRFYTRISANDIDMGGEIYRETKELMTLRNKYVHYEEDAIHNKLGVIHYDGEYPLHPIEKNRPAIEALIKTYHQPDIYTVKKAFDTSNKFVSMIESLFINELKDNLRFLIEQNPIGFNEHSGVYSAVYTPNAVDFFTE
ncbi:hypothetical protein ABIC74_000819 [Mucilaginibacter rubeus]|uniref:hypothetical protein n=1 Tax=Mucilaginibacter rubeus TaxID=2027860 RepID=UPI0033993BF1